MSKEKENFCLIIFFALALGVLADFLFYQKPIGVSFFIFNSIIIIFSLILAKKFKLKLSKSQIFILVSILLFSAGVFLRSSSFLTFFNVIGSAYLSLFFFALFLNKNILNFEFLKYLTVPISFFLKFFSAAARLFEKYKNIIPENGKIGSKEFRSVIKGFIIAAPFLIILFWLLSSADLVFQSYAERFIKINLDIEAISRALKILVVSYFFIGIFSKIAEGEKSENIKKETKENKVLGFIESSTVLILVELLLLAFIAIQFFYLFGGKDYVWGIDEYITYSEYAKNGFYELIAAAIISFLLIYGLDKFGKKESTKEKKIFKILSAVLILEMSVIIFSAFTRLSVYTDGYGLTFSRFLAFAFLFWIFSVFIIFLYKIFKEKRESIFLFFIFSLSIIFWAGINIINPDAFIARENMERFIQGKELDPLYFFSLSGDAVPEVARIFKLKADEEAKKKIAINLYWRYDSPPDYSHCYDLSQCQPVPFGEKLKYAEEKQTWQSFNLSESKALSALWENYDEIVKYQEKYWEEEKKRRKDGNEKLWGEM